MGGVRAVMAVKRLVRPLIPDRVMARYRLRQHSRQVRTNVDVLVDERRSARRWLATTPDTYRVLGRRPVAMAADPGLALFGDDAHHDVAAGLLAIPGAEVGVVARVGQLELVGRRRREPDLDPVAIAAPVSVVDEVGGAPSGPEPLHGLLARLRDAGRRIALFPLPGTPVLSGRTDPISAPSAVILAAVPMYDIGGGSRSAQIALDLLERGFHVTYVAMYGSEESVDLGIRHIHPNLEQYRVDQFDAPSLVRRVAAPALAIVEVPAPVLLPAARALAAAGWRLGYDRIDDWSDPELGWEWYDPAVERSFAGAADATFASAPDLVADLEAMGAEATLIPNAVNASLFAGTASPPDDLPPGEGPLLGYHGSLYGEWFDWSALAAVARHWPEARLLLIGDPKGASHRLPDNVVLLGLKPQGELPGYLQRLDVGLLPFVVSDMTHAVSPLKVYEYLASGVPVAAPPLRSLEGLDGVHCSTDLIEAVAAAMTAPRPDRAAVLDAHSWRVRVDAMLAGLGVPAPEQGAAGALVVARRVRHYDRGSRDVIAGGGNLGRP